MFTVGFGIVKFPTERLEEAVTGMVAVFNLVGPTVTFVMAVVFAMLQTCIIAQWPGKDGQHSCRMIVNRILWMPLMQILIFNAEMRAFLLCIFYGSAGQHGALQYRARKKVGAVKTDRFVQEPDVERDDVDGSEFGI